MPKLLIVDDEEATLDMLATYLSLIGHQTVSAVNGHDGLHKVQAENPDLMLLDLMMPDIQGYEVCAALRTQADYSTLPILIISARTDQDSKDKAMSSGADGYFTKPLDLPLLTQEIERLLANPPQHDLPANGSSESGEVSQPLVEEEKSAEEHKQPKSGRDSSPSGEAHKSDATPTDPGTAEPSDNSVSDSPSQN